jgi:GDP-L-fucose synthase
MTFGKVLVAGGNGFLGKKVTEKLKELDLQVLSLSRRNGFDFRQFGPTMKLFEKEKFDAVVNCAAFVGGIQFGVQIPGEVFFNNMLINTYLIEAARKSNVKRFINPLSNCTYPARCEQFREDDWWNGPLHETVLSYGIAKKASWTQSWAYYKQYHFETVNLVLPNMFGPGDHFDEVRSHALGALVSKFIEAKKRNMPSVTVWGTGKPIREWLYVDDGAEALVRALKIDHPVDPINIGVGKGISTIDLAETIKETVGYQGEIVLDPTKPDGAPCKIMDVTKMRQLFNWAPQTCLAEGIKKTVDWYTEAHI